MVGLLRDLKAANETIETKMSSAAPAALSEQQAHTALQGHGIVPPGHIGKERSMNTHSIQDSSSAFATSSVLKSMAGCEREERRALRLQFRQNLQHLQPQGQSPFLLFLKIRR